LIKNEHLSVRSSLNENTKGASVLCFSRNKAEVSNRYPHSGPVVIKAIVVDVLLFDGNLSHLCVVLVLRTCVQTVVLSINALHVKLQVLEEVHIEERLLPVRVASVRSASRIALSISSVEAEASEITIRN